MVHDLSTKRGHRGCARGQTRGGTVRAERTRPYATTGAAATAARALTEAGRYFRGRRRRLHDATVEPAGGAPRADLQGALAGQRACTLYYVERHRSGRPPPAL